MRPWGITEVAGTAPNGRFFPRIFEPTGSHEKPLVCLPDASPHAAYRLSSISVTSPA